MNTLIDKVRDFIKVKLGIFGVLCIYRYSSWLFTSLFYLTLYEGSSVPFKLGVIISVFIAAKAATNIYVKYYNYYSIMEITILVETLCILLLLVPTAGIDSPFIWYALNPVLVAACFLSPYFCWLNLAIYLFASTLISFRFFSHSRDIGALIYDNLYLMLVFVLITLIVQFLSRLSKRLHFQAAELTEQKEKLERLNSALTLSNERYKHSMDHIMSLYEIVEAFYNPANIKSFLQTFSDYTLK